MDHPSHPSPQSQSFFQSKTFKGILYGIAIVVILLLTFEAGVYMGYQKAMFSSHWAQNYQLNFFPHPDDHFPPILQDHGMMNSHGAFGDVVSINGSTIVVKGHDEAEKTVLIQPETMIEREFDKLKTTDLVVGQHVIIFGDPNDAGQIQAKLIRILPQVISFLH